MVYRNDDVAALDAMERHRLGNYGDYDEDKGCPECGLLNPEFVYINEDNEVVGCESCLRKVYPNE